MASASRLPRLNLRCWTVSQAGGGFLFEVGLTSTDSGVGGPAGRPLNRSLYRICFGQLDHHHLSLEEFKVTSLSNKTITLTWVSIIVTFSNINKKETIQESNAACIQKGQTVITPTLTLN